MNEPAFPSQKKITIKDGQGYVQDKVIIEGGMTLRDYFASKAMQANANDYQDTPKHMAERAYEIADAMLHQRNKEAGK